MIIWVCDKCGCEVQGKKPVECPLCRRKDAEFERCEKPDPDIEEKKSSKKYKDVMNKLEKYSEDCEPESLKYFVED